MEKCQHVIPRWNEVKTRDGVIRVVTVPLLQFLLHFSMFDKTCDLSIMHKVANKKKYQIDFKITKKRGVVWVWWYKAKVYSFTLVFYFSHLFAFFSFNECNIRSVLPLLVRWLLWIPGEPLERIFYGCPELFSKQLRTNHEIRSFSLSSVQCLNDFSPFYPAASREFIHAYIDTHSTLLFAPTALFLNRAFSINESFSQYGTEMDDWVSKVRRFVFV